MGSLLTLLRRKRAVGGFSPVDIAGLQLWLDASDTSTITEVGGAVSQWDDKSSNSYAFVQANAALQPSTGTTTQAGKNTLAFAGDYFTESTNSLSAFKFLHDGTQHTIFVVSKSGLVAEPDASYGLMGTNRSAGANTGFSIYPDDRSSVPRDRQVVHTITRLFPVANISAAGEYIFGEHVLLRVSGDPGNAVAADRSVITVNAGTEIKNNTGTVAPSTGDHTYPLQIGALGGTLAFLTGEIAEILVYDSALSTVDRERVEAYLSARWNIPLV